MTTYEILCIVFNSMMFIIGLITLIVFIISVIFNTKK